jgi:hypothetical protein
VSKTTETKQRQAKALELHLAGASYQQIADLCDYASKSGAHKAVQAALDDLAPDTTAVQATAIARIDAMLNGLWSKARRGDVQAVDRVIKLEQERRTILEAEAAGAKPEESRGGSKLAKLRAIHVDERRAG